ncbi:MAG: SSS family solute:Na+ symporter [Francisellaceae bacterium]|jgi:SSS family solute:Na+ symporter
MTIINWISFAILIFIVAFITFKTQKKTKNAQSYFVSNKKTTLFALVATLVMTELNTSTLVGFASLGYHYGFSAVSLALVFLIGLLFYAISVAKKWKSFDGISITTYFEKRYNKSIGYVSAIILLLAMIGFSANYIKSLTLIFAPLFPGLNEWTLSGLFCLIMSLITLRGGLKSIIQIDIISFLITLVIFPLIFYISYSTYHTPSFAPIVKVGSQFPLSMLIALIIITMFTYILAPWYGQKIFSANSPKTAFRAVAIAAVIISAFYALAILAASFLLDQPKIHIQAQEAIPYLIHNHFPIVIQGIAYAVLFFIASTTLVGLWNTIASVFIAHHHTVLKKTSLKTSMITTGIIAIFSYVLANVFIDQIFQKMVLMNIPIAALAFSLLGGFYWKRVSSIACALSTLVGFGGGSWCYLYFGEPSYMWYWAVFVIPASFIVGVIATLIFPRAEVS